MIHFVLQPCKHIWAQVVVFSGGKWKVHLQFSAQSSIRNITLLQVNSITEFQLLSNLFWAAFAKTIFSTVPLPVKTEETCSSQHQQSTAKRKFCVDHWSSKTNIHFKWHVTNSIIYHDFFHCQITSIAILQLPAFSLALLGLLRATRCSDVLKTVPLVCTPFFLLGFLDFFFSFLFQQCTKKGLEKAGLLWFLGSTEEQRALGLDTSRVFSGHAIQLLFQVFFTSFHLMLSDPFTVSQERSQPIITCIRDFFSWTFVSQP